MAIKRTSPIPRRVRVLNGAGRVNRTILSARVADIEKEAVRQEKNALAMYGMLEDTDLRIALLRRTLAVWGLTADDVGILSIHGMESTGANEENDTEI